MTKRVRCVDAVNRVIVIRSSYRPRMNETALMTAAVYTSDSNSVHPVPVKALKKSSHSSVASRQMLLDPPNYHAMHQ